MGRKKIPGLQKRNGVWHIDKKIFGKRICESTGTSNIEEAEKFLAYKSEELRKTKYFGERPRKTFLEAATKFLRENQHKASIADDAGRLKLLVQYIGDLNIDSIHMGSFVNFINSRRKSGIATRTINHALQVTRRILNLAATEWIDESGLTWLFVAPKIKLLKETDRREPYALSWDEQDRIFNELPDHLIKMVLFKVNTGCREQEVCQLRWEWEIEIPELNTSVFVIPKRISENGIDRSLVKNGEHRLVVLNHIAKSIIDQARMKHPEFVFTYQGQSIRSINNSAWRKARERVNLSHVRVHDLKHTFGRRLRSAGVSFEDRQDLLGHKSARITTHYSPAELENLLKAANKVCERKNCGTVINLFR